MTNIHSSERKAIPSANDDEIALVDLAVALAKHKKIIMLLPLVAAVLAAAISFFLPNVYKSSTKLLPPQQSQSAASSMLSQLGGMGGLAAGVAGLKNPSELYVGMLKSETVADILIKKYDLKTFYETDSRAIARQQLASNTIISAGKDGFINIEVTSTKKELAAKLANSYVEELAVLNKKLAVTEAGQRRMFFESQLERAKSNLANAEMSLKHGLSSSGVISVDSESQTVIETIARLRAQITSKDVELNATKPFLTTSHPNYIRLVNEISSLRTELRKLEQGAGDAHIQDAGQGSKNPSFDNIQRVRDLKYHQMLYEMLARQFEAARLDEAKEPSIIQVLDVATVAEHKHKPNRLFIVSVSAFLALVIAILWALLSEAKRKVKQMPNMNERLAELKENLKFR